MIGRDWSWTGIFKTADGGYDVNRFVGLVGGLTYIVGAHVFVGWELILGRGFDLATYCLAFPGGLAFVAGGTAGAVALKDRNVAKAKAEAEGVQQ
ncbi:hypothetical protein DAH66_12610 [Sphingomonas koreensis]|uniref:Uncharacterized protein n=1 Tax=Sphingomonas koreensis TaxID=93064 RepID=A0A430G2A9_9SPHN|nr:hypothetical protein [Sphingomonas koreensis]RSY83104.1 hypothetical protein DAH66_12610 [Sphingomonas koreensis]